MTQAVITTQRLILRPLVAEDAEDITRFISDFEVSKWLTHAPHPYALKDATDFLETQTDKAGRVWAITRDTAFQGLIGTQNELGYWLGKPFWGQGIMKEAARAVTDAYFADPSAQKLVSGHFLDNAGSRSVLCSLGFTDTHVEDASSVSQGKDVKLQRMALLRQTWAAGHA